MKKYENPTVQVVKFEVEQDMMINVSSVNNDPNWGDLVD